MNTNLRFIKLGITALVILSSQFTEGSNYYFSSSLGDDSRTRVQALNPATPWKTITKLNSYFISLSPRDSVLFKTGDVFTGTITPTISGTLANPIIISSYGSGAKPVISGFQTVTGWTNEGNGIYSKVISAESTPNMVTVNGVNTPMGRYPNKGWNTGDNFTGRITVTDAALPATPNLTGGTIVVRSRRWVIDKSIISNHSGTTLNFGSLGSYDPSDGSGYFVQNVIGTLDTLSEWCYTGGTLYMYFGESIDPDDYTVKVSSLNSLINISRKNYIDIENISIQGANTNAINLNNASHIIIQDCDINYSGLRAIYCHTSSTHNDVKYCIINNSNSTGVEFDGSTSHITIGNNEIYNSGAIIGMGAGGDVSYTGIISLGDNSSAKYNTIKTCGYDGLRFEGSDVTITHNFIDTYCIHKDDGAGIYSYRDTTAINKTITYNTIINGIGNPTGWAGYYEDDVAHGIYMDGAHDNVIAYNSIANNAGAGIYANVGEDNNIHHNTMYNNKQSLLLTSKLSSWDIYARNITFTYNICFAKEANQYTFYYATKQGASEVPLFGISDYNYFARPIKNDNYIDVWINAWGWAPGDQSYYTLAQWQSIYGKDIHSHESPKTITNTSDLRFEYNVTSSPVVIILPYNYMDVTGTTYNGTITLAPYTSVVLIKVGAITNHPPSIQDQGFHMNKNSPNATYVGTVVASDPDAGQALTYSIVAGNTNGAFAINALTGMLSVANSTALTVDFSLVVKVQDNGFGELSSQATIVINIIPSGFELTGNNGAIKVYPNPVSDELNIELKGNNERLSFNILNSQGQIVFEGNLTEKAVVLMTSFSPGVYLMKIGDGRTLEFTKIVKV